jgi:hypothetical protein
MSTFEAIGAAETKAAKATMARPTTFILNSRLLYLERDEERSVVLKDVVEMNERAAVFMLKSQRRGGAGWSEIILEIRAYNNLK